MRVLYAKSDKNGRNNDGLILVTKAPHLIPVIQNPLGEVYCQRPLQIQFEASNKNLLNNMSNVWAEIQVCLSRTKTKRKGVTYYGVRMVLPGEITF
jgi:hypothetical protein